MGKKGGSAPPAPNPKETAAAEFQFNNYDSYSESGSGTRYGYTDPESNEFVQGPRPEDVDAQSAVSYLESPWETEIRELLQPASVSLVDRVVTDNVDNMPDAARAGFEGSFTDMLSGLMKQNANDVPDLARALFGGQFEGALGKTLSENKRDRAQIARSQYDSEFSESLGNTLSENAEDRAQIARTQYDDKFSGSLGRILDANAEDEPDVARIKNRGNIGKNIFNRTARTLQPEMEKQEERLLTNLQNRGLPVGSEAFNEAYGEQTERTQETLARLAMDSDIAAGQEQNRLFGLEDAQRRSFIGELGFAGQEQGRLYGLDADERNSMQRELAVAGQEQGRLFGLDAAERDNMQRELAMAGQEQGRLFGMDASMRQNYLAEMDFSGREQGRQFNLDSAERSGSISELVAAMGGGYNPPNSVPQGSGANINYSGMVQNKYNADLNAWNAKQEQSMGAMQTAGSLASLLFKSTVTSKEVLGPVSPAMAGQVVSNLPVYQWKYLEGEQPQGDHGGLHIGPMAEQFQKVTGLGASSHIDAIDYMGLLLAGLQSALQRIHLLEAWVSHMARDGSPEDFTLAPKAELN